MTEKNWELLVKQAKQQQPGAFAALCEAKGRDILYLCIKLMGNEHDGEDAAQEVFLKMQKSIGQLKHESAFHVWVNQIISNTCNTMRRNTMKQKGLVPLDEEDRRFIEERVEFLPAEYAEEKSKKGEVLGVLADLPYQYQEVIYLFYYENLSIEEIAIVLDRNKNSTNHLLRRARANLKTKLEAKTGAKFPFFAMALPAGVTVLGQIIKENAQLKISSQMVQALIQESVLCAGAVGAGAVSTGTVGTGAVSTGAAASSGGIVSTGLFKVGTILLSGTLLAGGTYLASNVLQAAPQPVLPISSSAISSVEAVPQQPQTGEMAEEDLVIESALLALPQGAELISQVPPATQPHSSTPVAGDSVPEGILPQTPPTTLPNNRSRYISLAGIIAFKNTRGEVVPTASPYSKGYLVEVVLNERVLAQTKAEADGTFKLKSVPLPAEGDYIIRVQPTSNAGVVPHADNPKGERTVHLTYGDETIELPALYVTDDSPPTGSILFYDAAWQSLQGGLLNPSHIALLVGDATATHTTWVLTGKGQATVLAKGEGQTIEKLPSLLGTSLASGWYTVVFTITDAAENTTQIERNFRWGG